VKPLWLTVFLAWTTTAPAAVRVALVGNAEAPATAKVIDLATDLLSTVRGLEVFDRQEVEGVLKEQGIATSGLADPEQALAAGQFLGVDVLAVVESDAPQALGPAGPAPGTAPGPPVGLLVYSPKSGLRLWDEALPAADAEAAASAIAAGVTQALGRQQSLGQGGRCLALLGVRNADLPQELDTLCDAVATLLERQLLRFPDTGVLERRRRQPATDAPQPVPETVDPALRGSLRTLAVELGRGETPDALRATVSLSDADGKALGSCMASGPARDLPGLVHALTEELAKALNTTAAEDTADRAREAHRCASEAVRYMARRDGHGRPRAVAAAETAFALVPALPHAKLLSYQLLVAAMDLILPDPKGPPPTREDVLRSLGRTRRAVDVRAEMMQTVAREQPEAVYAYRAGEDPAFNHLLGLVMAQANRLALGESPLGRDEVGPVRAAALAYLRAGIDQMCATVASPTGSFEGYTLRTCTDLDESLRVCAGTEEYLGLLLPVARAWLDLAATLPPERLMDPTSAGLQTNALLDLVLLGLWGQVRDLRLAWRLDGEARAAAVWTLLPALREHPHPTVRLYAALVELRTAPPGQDGAPAADETAFAAGVVQAVRAALEAPTGPWPIAPTHAQAYYAAVAVGDRPAAVLGLWRLMLDRREVVPDLIRRGLGVLTQDPAPADALALIDRTLDLCDQRDRYLGPETSPVKLKADLLTARARLSPAPAPAGAAAAWCEAKRVLDVAKLEDTTTLRQCFAVGDFVYGVALKQTESLRPFRFDYEDAQVEWLGPAQKLVVSTPEIPLNAVSSRLPCISSACLGPEHLFVGTLEQGTVAFPLKGGPALWLDTAAGLPSNTVRALACLEGKLYLSLGDTSGSLVSFDLQTRHVEVLAASQRQEPRSPLDGAGRFTITHLAADPARRQLLVGGLTGPGQGLWSLDPPSGALERLFTGRGPDWGSRVRGNKLLFENYRTTVVYDLDAKAPRLLRASTRFRELPDYDVSAVPIKDLDMHPGPQALIRDWLWVPRPLSRISLRNGAVQVAPPLGDGNDAHPLNPATFIEPADGGKHVLVGDWSGLWVLTPSAVPGKE